MGGSRKLEITIVSAEDLPDLRRLWAMRVYAVVSVDGITRRTGVDWEGETDPTWNSVFVFDIKESYLEKGGLDVVVNLFCERTLDDRFIGQVRIPAKEMFEKEPESSKSVITYPVAGTPFGKLREDMVTYTTTFSLKPVLFTSSMTMVRRRDPPPPPPPPPPRREMIEAQTTLTFKTMKYVDYT